MRRAVALLIPAALMLVAPIPRTAIAQPASATFGVLEDGTLELSVDGEQIECSASASFFTAGDGREGLLVGGWTEHGFFAGSMVEGEASPRWPGGNYGVYADPFVPFLGFDPVMCTVEVDPVARTATVYAGPPVFGPSFYAGDIFDFLAGHCFLDRRRDGGGG